MVGCFVGGWARNQAWGLRFRGEWLYRAAMKCFSLLLLACAFASMSCERHDFEETRKLHDHGDHHGESHGDSHGDAQKGH